MEIVEYLRQAPTSPGELRAWCRGFEAFGKVTCVRVAIAAASVALEVWEKHEPTLRAPHDRIAAAKAWLVCPCEDHANAAGKLAWANGDDGELHWNELIVDGKVIENRNAVFAHWASDNAANVTWYAGPSGEITGTAASAAWGALGEEESNFARFIDAIANALTPHLPDADGADGGDPTETAFLAAIKRDSSDNETRIVYADWLEEHGHLNEAAFLRAEIDPSSTTMLTMLASRCHPKWRDMIARREHDRLRARARSAR